MIGYPIQTAKVQGPPLREETLARARLLDWLAAKIHHRVVLVTAEAGYGKTTLLADFSRRSRHRTLWYRLDGEDRDWSAFLSYLVAAGKEADPDFAPLTASLLRELGTTGPQLPQVLETFVREIGSLGEAGAAIILDDFHVVDDTPDVRMIVRELIARAPDRVTFVIAARRTPSLPIARLRAQGEVAELVTDDLRFNTEETERLFSESYGRPLEPDVLSDLTRRTEGWAASLQLVKAAIHGRTAGETRSFVRSLSGAEGDLYDYLAEEVVGALAPDLQRFLMCVALLEAVEVEHAAAVVDIGEDESRRLIDLGIRTGLLVKRSGRSSKTAFHPLVRQFLLRRLADEFGQEAVVGLHVRAARTAPHWSTACHHLAEAGHYDELLARLDTDVRAVMGGGQFQLAARYLKTCGEGNLTAPVAMIASRAELQAGRVEPALELASKGHHLDPSSLLGRVNYASLLVVAGQFARGLELVRTFPTTDQDPLLREILQSTTTLLKLSTEGDLDTFVERMVDMGERHGRAGLKHYRGISLLNAATCLRAQGKASQMLSITADAIDALSESGAEYELVTAHLVRAWALAHLGNWDAAMELASSIDRPPDPNLLLEALNDQALMHAWYGEPAVAERLVSEALRLHVHPTSLDMARVVAAELAVRQGQTDVAVSHLANVGGAGLNSEPAFRAHRLAVAAYVGSIERSPDVTALLDDAAGAAEQQKAHFWRHYVSLIRALMGSADVAPLPDEIRRDPAYLSVLADVVVPALSRLSPEDRTTVTAEAMLRRARWRAPLRREIENRGHSWTAAAELLDVVGEPSDVPLLRGLTRAARGTNANKGLGRGLARRLAPRVRVEDQGRVNVAVGDVSIPGTTVRRKVLALLCFLVSRPRFSATRDEVLDAMWPDLDPEIAANSLNQTVYFLRRLFEPEYQESLSPGYVHFDSSVVWLDTDLVTSRCTESWALIHAAEREVEGATDKLAEVYKGRFALDFAYDEWAIAYRDPLHAAYLAVIETAVAVDSATGRYSRGIHLARAALAVDPSAETLEASLIRLYRLAGAHSAAAEQYAHYATALRDELGVDVPAIENV